MVYAQKPKVLAVVGDVPSDPSRHNTLQERLLYSPSTVQQLIFVEFLESRGIQTRFVPTSGGYDADKDPRDDKRPPRTFDDIGGRLDGSDHLVVVIPNDGSDWEAARETFRHYPLSTYLKGLNYETIAQIVTGDRSVKLPENFYKTSHDQLSEGITFSGNRAWKHGKEMQSD